jgi:hypothetical protein
MPTSIGNDPGFFSRRLMFAEKEGEDSPEFQEPARLALVNPPLHEPRILNSSEMQATMCLGLCLYLGRELRPFLMGVGKQVVH